MLKARIIGVVVVTEGISVQSINFTKYLPIGSPAISIEYLNNWGIDEIVYLDIHARKNGRCVKYNDIVQNASQCNVPFTIGGGISTIDEIKMIVSSGADKIIINTSSIENPSLITEGAKLYGNQCIVVAIDAKKKQNGEYIVYSHSGTRETPYTPGDLAKRAEAYGAGEILINSIDKDGAKTGYDIELIKEVVNSVSIPVIAFGGAGHPKHFKEALDIGINAVAAANFFHFTEHSVITTKKYLQINNCNIRSDTYASYDNQNFNENGRIIKQDDTILEKLRFEYIPEEVI